MHSDIGVSFGIGGDVYVENDKGVYREWKYDIMMSSHQEGTVSLLAHIWAPFQKR